MPTVTPGPEQSTCGYLCQEGHGVVVSLRGHLSDQVFGAVFQQFLFNGIATHKPTNKTQTHSDSQVTGAQGTPSGLRREGGVL